MLWLRWTLRDLRARWAQILATGLILAVGVGAFAGMGGLEQWRVESADRSLAATRAHDLRVDLADGSFARAGTLLAALSGDAIGEERLVVPSQVDASRPSRPVVAPARLIGVGTTDAVDLVSVREGRPGVVLDWNFAHYYDLPASGDVRLAGLGTVRYTGTGVSPQHFLVVNEAGMPGAEAGLATVYLPLADAQRASGHAGMVNQLVVRVRAGGSVAAVAGELRDALPEALVTLADDEPVKRMLYRDAENDQKTYWTFAVLLILGATLAAFNLVSRVVEAQRREIGIAMALGVSPRRLALRPLALGLQIGILGALLSVPVGIGLSELIRGLFRDYLPLPVYATTFPAGLYVAGALIAVVLPVAAGLLPVRRAVSVPPVDAIRTGHRSAASAGWTTRLRGLRVPGGELVRLPLRNLARTPRRTVMTFVGLGAVMTGVIGVLGMLDSLVDMADRQRAATLSSSPTRLEVTLAGMEPRDGAVVRELSALEGVRRAEPGLTVMARAGGSEALDVVLTFVEPRSAVWRPSVTAGRAAGDGILLAEKAVKDLGVGVGDRVRVRIGDAGVAVPVLGVHTNPIRAFAYMDTGMAARFGLGGVANTVALVPAADASPGTLERALFGHAGVASVRPASASADSLETSLGAFTSSVVLLVVVTLGMALLVAFTSTSVAFDERRREYATMQAFGLPPRTGLRVAMTESLAMGLAGTAVGIGIGMLVILWIVGVLVPDTMPDLGARMVLAPLSIAITLLVGIVAVAVAPLLVFRRMRRMDIPSTLRVME